jgi:hypothetical protein
MIDGEFQFCSAGVTVLAVSVGLVYDAGLRFELTEQNPPQPIQPRFPRHYRQLRSGAESLESMICSWPYMQLTLRSVTPHVLRILDILIAKCLR